MQAIAQPAAEAILGNLIPGFALAAFAWGFVRVFPLGKASRRFAVWFSALGGIALLPLLQVSLRTRFAESVFARNEHSLIVLPQQWAVYLPGLWLLVVLAGLGRVAAAAGHLRRVRLNSTVIDPAELSSEAHTTIARALQTRAFELRVSDRIHVPVAIGFFRPAIIIPAYLLEELSPVQLSQVLLHEATHLRRYDDWTNLLQKVARALLFFHPAVWWLENKLTLEREIACDEAVVAETADPRSYAECLALLAEKTLFRRSLALVQTAVSRLRHTTLRVKELLAPAQSKAARSWAGAAGVIGVLACSVVLGQMPELVSFQSRTTFQAQTTPVTSTQQSLASIPERASTQSLPVLSAEFKPGPRRLPPANEVAKLRPQSRRPIPSATVETLSPVEQQPEVVLASHSDTQPVPVVVTTTMIIESENGSGTAQQVWRLWQVTVFYPAPDKAIRPAPRAI